MSYEKIKDYWEKSTPMAFKEEKWDYNERRKFRYELQDYMHESIGFDQWKGKKVCEIGCGGGIDLMEFGRNGANMYGIDLTQNGIDLTFETSKQAGMCAVLAQANVVDGLPFVENYFDCLYSYGVLHHIPDIDKTLIEIKRVMKPNSQIIVMLYNKDSLLYAYSIQHLHKSTGLSEDELTGMYSERNEGCPYTKAYTKQEAIDLFSKYFKDVEVKTYYNVIDTPKQRKVKLDNGGECEWGWHHIVKAVK
jgi:2-polyprenyl-3-methyl-5-hydroxy-6-metoxy-1,4-benzoquinol methylase